MESFWVQKVKKAEKWCEMTAELKSDNLQYNTLVRWFAGTNDLSTKRLMFQCHFFIISSRLRALKTFFFMFWQIYKK